MRGFWGLCLFLVLLYFFFVLGLVEGLICIYLVFSSSGVFGYFVVKWVVIVFDVEVVLELNSDSYSVVELRSSCIILVVFVIVWRGKCDFLGIGVYCL